MANFKGGVGKSTTAVNVAAALAATGNRTLLVDVDPQANASEMFISEAEIEYDLRSIIIDKVPTEKVIHRELRPHLDVLPATIDLTTLDRELVVTPAGVFKIRRALRDVAEQYDYLIMDTGPNLSQLTLGALATAKHLVIPVSAAVWSSRGLLTFLGWIDDHRQEEVVTADLLGVAATMVVPNTRIGKGLLADMEVSPLPSFRTWIPRRTRAEDAVMDGLVTGDPGMDISLDTSYRDLTAEMVERLGDGGGARHAR